MHGALDPHLHTDDCNAIIRALQECQASTNKISQLFGVCNDLDMAMRKCTKQERLAKTKVNLEEAKIKQARTREKIAKMQADGKTWQDVLKERKAKVDDDINKTREENSSK